MITLQEMAVGEHDLSKQECHHILNGLDFVEFSRDFVPLTIMGTKTVRTPKSADDNQDATENKLANIVQKLFKAKARPSPIKKLK